MPYADPDVSREYRRLWAERARKKDPTDSRERVARHRAKHPERVKENQRRWYHERGGREKEKARIDERKGIDRSLVRLCVWCRDPISPDLRIDAKYCSRLCRQRGARLKLEYGLTLVAYQELWDSQNGCCAGCGDALSKPHGRDSHIDHCHETGAVRGILHGTCNMALGMVGDDPVRMRSLAEYAEKHSQLRIKCIS